MKFEGRALLDSSVDTEKARWHDTRRFSKDTPAREVRRRSSWTDVRDVVDDDGGAVGETSSPHCRCTGDGEQVVAADIPAVRFGVVTGKPQRWVDTTQQAMSLYTMEKTSIKIMER
ncbi:hypothetical protein JTB14_021748 [Gonioctena quinquepunctata]|nr:hypothetical protein JTB14_021748 [Gonioctena quinquepunctata]